VVKIDTSNRAAFLLLGTAILCFAALSPAQEGSPADAISVDAIRGHVFFLACDALEGRYVGSPGYEVASKYGESQFKSAGLVPAVPGAVGNSYLQEVPVLRRRASGEISLTVATQRGSATFREGEEFKWFQGEMFPLEDRAFRAVFVGYGISEPRHGWDDLEGLDVRGKVVLLMMGAPTRESQPVLPESVHALYAPPSAVFRKMITMLVEGAAGIFVIPDEILTAGWETLDSKAANQQFEYDNRAPGAIHIPLLCPMKPEVAEAIFAGQKCVPPGMGHLGEECTDGFELKDVLLTLDGSFTEERIPTYNVVGVVYGSDPVLRDEYVVVTAHLDSTAPREIGEINNGADDNASGCAGLMEIARAVALSPPRRSVVFGLLSGEEAACIGSRHLVSDCPVPLDKIVANVNMDMIGRSDAASQAERSHYAIDSEKITPAFTDLIKDVNARSVRWPLKYESPVGTSDNLMFHAVGIPAVSFYSGHHEDVNRPTDDPDKIDYEKAQKIAQLVYEVTMEVGNRQVLW
jgi:hypothetical protein